MSTWDLFDPPARHDPGGKTRLRMQPGVVGSAMFSPCERYRYWLRREWGQPRAVNPFLLSIGMNPSTADPLFDDPTVRRDISLARREGFPAMVKVNVCDYRATSPKMLLADGVLPCSPENLAHINRLAHQAPLILVAWGAMHRSLSEYVRGVLMALSGRELWCLGTTRDGSPKHPLYVAGNTRLVRFRASESDE